MKCRLSSILSPAGRTLLVLCLAALAFVSQGRPSYGTAFISSTFTNGGNPKTAAYPNANSDFFRWQQSTITYAFTPAWVAAYGVGAEAPVSRAFATWTASLTGNNTAPTDATAANVNFNTANGDYGITTSTGVFDLQSVALHEIGHTIGLTHPNDGNSPNYNVVAGDWGAAAALPAGSHPVMWSTIPAGKDLQVLTLDDIRASQFLYSTAAAGAGNGPAGGPVFGNNATGLTFQQVAFNPNATNNNQSILIDAGTASSTVADALAVTFRRTGGTFAAVGGFTYTTANNNSLMTIDFPIPVPEPSSIVLAFLGVAGMAVVVLRRQASALALARLA